ncbi:gamma-glutamylcyclotransferase [Rouxiella badensis]|jgi:gamma-glutamylcyclotransferase (GGCT)/AIG2-like uncharacterized protein YtfP|uniref:gamma-glutamylcyclotransferase family protein n=1 Tax=Rouxiella badensis TaxID=1646377 RepID=UPI001D1504C0|nr:gamma-glutamylcyclotransferase family protein [Rouxiella badensis]MCC3720477.1 gamma-glutamylcyclotransferase [Rouxiella badensis]MCC3730316.1 gamma-glutamylcyclotransferase [Rouxiella badensis]MCC3734508.1 gamma-glutamylcyclotransferase [Rouxiella badensis]MCC3742242.1 gamma-glutamylcyclotransferase [Rouxiella badensis]MCC3759981.1 gamma-glutamylcyclotransferase [Rouxiella badensis]
MPNDSCFLKDEYFQLFAYGSCMNHESLSKTLLTDAKAYFIGPALLAHHRLIFNYSSLNEPVCCANIRPDYGHRVEGALYRLPTRFLDIIDAREGVPLGRYKRQRVGVTTLTEGQDTTAFTYFGLVTLNDEAAPSIRYRDLLLQGLYDARVSSRYKLSLRQHLDSLPERLMNIS